MSEVVERVARAICLDRGLNPDETLDSIAVSRDPKTRVCARERIIGKPRWTYFVDEAQREPKTQAGESL